MKFLVCKEIINLLFYYLTNGNVDDQNPIYIMTEQLFVKPFDGKGNLSIAICEMLFVDEF